MNYTPDVKPLSYKHRQRVFFVCLIIFVVVMPIFIFYAMGYRFDFGGIDRTIVSIGGMYIGSDTETTQLFVDEVPVVGVRLFRKASYIQNLSVGVHSVRVQGEGLHTWVKDLPVYSQIVTEANAFNLPRVPQVRPITEFITADGEPVFIVTDASTTLFAHASTSRPIFVTEKVGTSTFSHNSEYDYVVSLFASSSHATSTLLERMTQDMNSTFNFSSSLSQESGTTTSTTTRQRGESRMYERGGEVFVSWEGGNNNRPYYYCLFFTTEASTTERYGEHVTQSIREMYKKEIDEKGEWVCRDSIRIDRKHQQVRWFDFFPGTTDVVLMLLEDGLYAVEVDDRAWQNVQQLYSSRGIEVVLDGDRLYVRDDETYFELLTELFE